MTSRNNNRGHLEEVFITALPGGGTILKSFAEVDSGQRYSTSKIAKFAVAIVIELIITTALTATRVLTVPFTF